MDTRAVAEILPIDDPRVLRRAAETLRAGGLICFPSDIGYNLGGDVGQATAIAALRAVPEGLTEKGVLVLLSSAAGLPTVARAVPEATWRLVEAFWPGPLSIVLPRHPAIHDFVGEGARTVWVQVPAPRSLLRLLETARVGLASTGISLGRDVAPLGIGALSAALPGVRLILDGGTRPPGPPATVVDLTGETPAILRQGSISVAEIARALGQNPLVRI